MRNMKKKINVIIIMTAMMLFIIGGMTSVYAICDNCIRGNHGGCGSGHTNKYYDGTYHMAYCNCCNAQVTGGNSKHSYSTKYNSSQHWSECSGCGDTKNYKNHNMKYNEVATAQNHTMKCTECYRKTTESHSFTKYQDVDSSNHKTVCSVCDYSGTTSGHSFSYSQNDDTTHTAYCSSCGGTYYFNHSYGGVESEGYGTNNRHYKTCTISGCGYTKYLGYHTYGAWEYVSESGHKRECTYAGCTSASSVIAHSGGNSDCLNKAKCSDCNSEYGGFGAHAYDAGVITTAPTCATTGIKTYTCTICSNKKTETVPATGNHTYGDWHYDDVTNHRRDCTNTKCSAYETSSHTGGTATCTAKAKCSVCGGEYGELLPHTWPESYTHNDDRHWKDCTVCGSNLTTGAHIDVSPENGICDVCDYVIDREPPTYTITKQNKGNDIYVSVQINDVRGIAGYNWTSSNVRPSSWTSLAANPKTYTTTKDITTETVTYIWAIDIFGNVSYDAIYTYKITYNANGGSGAPAEMLKANDHARPISETIPTRAGYTFFEWNTKVDGMGHDSYDPSDNYTKNESATLYAQWVKNEFEIALKTRSYLYDGTFKTPEVIAKDGETVLTKGIDYDVSYTNNKNVGIATVTVTGIGKYIGTQRTINFPIVETKERYDEIMADYTRPEISLNGTPTLRYVNNLAEVTIPIKVTDAMSGALSSTFVREDIEVKVGGISKEPMEKTLDYIDGDIYQQNYTLTLEGLEGEGMLTLTIAEGYVLDLAVNKNETTVLEPPVIVDNTKPKIILSDIVSTPRANVNTLIEIPLRVIDIHSGITEEQFKLDDIEIQLNGSKIVPPVMELIQILTTSEYDEVDFVVAGQYDYILKLQGIEDNGALRIKIDKEKVIDRALNPNDAVTIPLNITIDNRGPNIGEITVNTDEHGRLFGEETLLEIRDCTDESGIGEYEWQYSKDGVTNWETIKLEPSALDNSSANHQLQENENAYYRVIVRDTLGNETISDTVQVVFTDYINRKPTIRLDSEPKSEDVVEITGIIKSSTPIVEIRVNGIDIENNLWENNVTKMNNEITTLVTYEARANGTYVFEATDSEGNVVTGKINISTIRTVPAVIDYEKYDITITSDAYIEFKSQEPVRIMDPDAYPGITFVDRDFKTTIIAVVDEGREFNTAETFKFENKGFKETDVVVEPPIITKLLYLRSYRENITNGLDATRKEIDKLVQNMSSSKIMVGTKIMSYYGTTSNGLTTKIASSDDIDVIEILGSADKVYTMTSIGEKGNELESTINTNIQQKTEYLNGNITGVYTPSGAVMYDGTTSDDTTRYDSVRIVIIP